MSQTDIRNYWSNKSKCTAEEVKIKQAEKNIIHHHKYLTDIVHDYQLDPNQNIRNLTAAEDEEDIAIENRLSLAQASSHSVQDELSHKNQCEDFDSEENFNDDEDQDDEVDQDELNTLADYDYPDDDEDQDDIDSDEDEDYQDGEDFDC